jgi:hypothetical protein
VRSQDEIVAVTALFAFCDTCDALGVDWRIMKRDVISIARRASVAKLDAFISPKR